MRPWTTPSSTGPKSPHDSQCPLLLKPCHPPFRVPSRQMQPNLNVPNQTSFRFSRLGLSFFALGLTIFSIWNTTEIQCGDWAGSSPYRGRAFSAQAARPHWHDTGKSLGTSACEVAKGLDALTTPLLLSSVPLNATFNQWQICVPGVLILQNNTGMGQRKSDQRHNIVALRAYGGSRLLRLN